MLSSTLTLKRVIGHEMQDRVEQAVRELSGSKPGSGAYLGKYKAGLADVANSLDPEEMQDMKDKREEWMKKNYPPEVQRKSVTIPLNTGICAGTGA